MGVQMVSRGRYQQAVAVLEAVCEHYPFNESFIAGQVHGASSQMHSPSSQKTLRKCWLSRIACCDDTFTAAPRGSAATDARTRRALGAYSLHGWLEFMLDAEQRVWRGRLRWAPTWACTSARVHCWATWRPRCSAGAAAWRRRRLAAARAQCACCPATAGITATTTSRAARRRGACRWV